MRYQKVSLWLRTQPCQLCLSPINPQTIALSLTSPLVFPTAEGRLNAAALNLLEGADIQFRRENRLDIALVKNLPIALIFLPAADIPTFVGQGRVDLGITGWDQVKEHDAAVKAAASEDPSSPVSGSEMVMDLEFGACKLQVQVPEKGQYATSADLIGRTIGTSFVSLTEEYFAQLEAQASGAAPQKLRTKIIELSGSVEAACALGVADGIVDLVGKLLLLPLLLVPALVSLSSKEEA